MGNLVCNSSDSDVAALFGEHTNAGGAVIGQSNRGRGILGISDVGQGVWGASTKSAGVVGVSNDADAVLGESKSPGHAGVAGVNEAGGNGLFGRGTGNGVYGHHTGSSGAGVVGESTNGEGVRGISHSRGHGGIVGISDHAEGVGVYGKGGRVAGFFEGDIEVTGDILLRNADCAEQFDIADTGLAEPGAVMILGEEGKLCLSSAAYDKRVAGVVSGAGDYQPGIILDRQECRTDSRAPIALVGKVYCKVDASRDSIEIGDLLTTSPIPGHAMKATDPHKAFGAVIGKALRPLKHGTSVIPILVALQ